MTRVQILKWYSKLLRYDVAGLLSCRQHWHSGVLFNLQDIRALGGWEDGRGFREHEDGKQVINAARTGVSVSRKSEAMA